MVMPRSLAKCKNSLIVLPKRNKAESNNLSDPPMGTPSKGVSEWIVYSVEGESK